MKLASIVISFSLLIIALNTSPLNAELFQSAYVSFNKPEGWTCDLEGTEWVCHNTKQGKKKEAIIILTAKEKGPGDSLITYESHLKMPKTIPTKTGGTKSSQVKLVKQVTINAQPWVDALHYGSEVSTYYTRYLATVKGNLGILVTFSAHKDRYKEYVGDFMNAVRSLRVTDQVIKPKTSLPAAGGSETYGDSGGGPIPDIDLEGIPSEPGIGGGSSNTSTYLGLLLVLAAIGFYIYKKKKG